MSNNKNGIQFVLAPSFDIATAGWRDCEGGEIAVTIEAEYGSHVVEGDVYTAAHHVDAYRHRPAPCNDEDIPVLKRGEKVLLSHLDLDSIGGALRTLEEFTYMMRHEDFRGFWELAEFVDLNGAHKLHHAQASEINRRRLNAWYAWAKTGVPRLGRDDLFPVSDIIRRCGKVLQVILSDDEELLAAGDVFAENSYEENKRTWVDLTDNGVVVRHLPSDGSITFANHMYDTPFGDVGKAVLTYSHKTGTVTASLESEIDGIDVAKVLQSLYGPEAGGRATVGGSPRGQRMTLEDFERGVALFDTLLGEHAA